MIPQQNTPFLTIPPQKGVLPLDTTAVVVLRTRRGIYL